MVYHPQPSRRPAGMSEDIKWKARSRNKTGTRWLLTRYGVTERLLPIVIVCVLGLLSLVLLLSAVHAQTQTFVAAEIESPLPGTTFTSNTIVFTWTDTGAPSYLLRVGSTLRGRDYYDGDEGSNTSATVPGLPTDENDW